MKLARLASGGAPRVVDLFSGCGGISLGFHRAGFSISGSVELDPWAAKSHALNFHGDDPGQVALHGRSRDMTTLEPDDFCKELDLGSPGEAVDILVGGPPCQAYARIGRAKLRDIANDPEAYKIDPRRDLYLRYIAWVDRLRPLALLIENVPDMLNQGGHNVAAEIADLLEGHGYVARYGLVNTAFYGVPQMRDRVFLIAYRKELALIPELPRPTRHLDLPQGYKGARSVALKYVDLLNAGSYMSPTTDASLQGAVTAEEALGDLPLLNGDDVTRGIRRRGPETWMAYRADVEPSQYALEMRRWQGFEAQGINDHFIRYLPRDGYIFEMMREGAEYPEAHRLAENAFKDKAKALRLRKNSQRWKELHAAMVPPYRTDTFPNRWWKLIRDEPSRTLMAHLGKDSYSHIHYDGSQRRTISVREAARLQSFPDGFRFAGTMNPSLRQIGNAVPPLMAWEIAKVMRSALESAVKRLKLERRLSVYG
ncbi:DNA cytosine methyltransferase [Teichococcus aestuarii]